MNIIDLRTRLRRSAATRFIADRRVVPYPFGSPEWLAYVKDNNVDCPEFDRRKVKRRAEDRRAGEQREENNQESAHTEKAYSRILLTPAERKLIEDLYFNDFE